MSVYVCSALHRAHLSSVSRIKPFPVRLSHRAVPRPSSHVIFCIGKSDQFSLLPPLPEGFFCLAHCIRKACQKALKSLALRFTVRVAGIKPFPGLLPVVSRLHPIPRCPFSPSAHLAPKACAAYQGLGIAAPSYQAETAICLKPATSGRIAASFRLKQWKRPQADRHWTPLEEQGSKARHEPSNPAGHSIPCRSRDFFDAVNGAASVSGCENTLPWA